MPILGVAAKKVAEAVEEAALDSVKTKRAKSSKGKTARKTKAKSKSGSAVFVALIAIAIVFSGFLATATDCVKKIAIESPSNCPHTAHSCGGILRISSDAR